MIDSSADRDPVDQLAEEFAARYRRGERPTVTEYTDRHPEHAEAIRALFPALLKLEQLKPGSADSPRTQTAHAGFPAAIPPKYIDDFRILREVGRGGMGIVYEAEQLSLGRHVVLKVLLGHHFSDWKLLQRFQREIRAAARLHHTNIVPVFGLGEHYDVPYYVMQFIQGLGLDEVLLELRRLLCSLEDEPHRRKDPSRRIRARRMAEDLLTTSTTRERQRPEPGSGPPSAVAQVSPERGKPYWLSIARIGMQVADALAYAHQQGILHRDIKPANLLLDLQGNTWVTDFSLAKTAGDEDSLTPSGDAVGTLRYMAPEGFHGEADPRSDIYSLGLTLYELLTLQPAFGPGDRSKFLKRVQCDVPAPRKVCPAVPRDLETIVLKAIAPDPGHRYATAEDMVHDLRCYLEDQPIRARRLSPGELLWRWCRRNPLVAGLAAALLLAVTAGFAAVFGLWQRAEEHGARAKLSAADAQGQRRLSQGNFQKAWEVVDLMLTRVGDESLRDIPHMEPVRRQILQDALKFYEDLRERQGDSPELRLETARANQRVGDINLLTGRLDAANEAYHAAWEQFASLNQELPDDAQHLVGLGETRLGLARVQTQSGRPEHAEPCSRQALAWFEALSQRYPDVPSHGALKAQALNALASALQSLGRHREADTALEQAVASLEAVVRHGTPEPRHLSALGATISARGTALESRLELGPSEAAYRQNLALQEKLVDQHPQVPEYRQRLAESLSQLGGILSRVGRYREAEASIQRAATETERLSADFPAVPAYRLRLASCRRNRAAVLVSMSRRADAEESLQGALALAERLTADFPEGTQFRWELARCRFQRCLSFDFTVPTTEVASEHDRVVAELEKLIAASPNVAEYRLTMARAYVRRGELSRFRQPWQETEELARLALGMCAQADSSGDVRRSQREVQAHAHQLLGQLFSDQRRSAEAVAEMKRALELAEPVAAETPGLVRYRSIVAAFSVNFAGVYRAAGNAADAEATYRRGCDLCHALINDFPELVRHPNWNGPLSLRGLVTLLRQQRRFDEAEAVQRQVQPLYENLAKSSSEGRAQLADWWSDLGALLRQANRMAETEQAWRRALDFYTGLIQAAPGVLAYQSQSHPRVLDLTGMLRRQSELPAVRDLLERAIETQQGAMLAEPGSAQSTEILGNYYRLLAETHLSGGDTKEAARACSEFVKRTGERVWFKAQAAYLSARVAQALDRRGDPVPAEKHRAEAERLLSTLTREPDLPQDRNILAWILAVIPEPDLRQPSRAMHLATTLTKSYPRVSRYWTTLGAAWYRAGDVPAARAALKRGLDLAGGDGLDWLFLAMIEARSDHLNKAKEWFDKATSWIEQSKPTDDELRMLRAEAASVLEQAAERAKQD